MKSTELIKELQDCMRADGPFGDDEEAQEYITQYLDDQLIYTSDIIDLAQEYGAIDDGELIGRFYDDLTNDIYTSVDINDYTTPDEEDD